VLRIVTRDDHVIDIEKKGATTRRSVDKKSRIVVTRIEASIDDNRGKTLKPSPRSLIKAIEGMTQSTNKTIRHRISWGWLHIDFLSELTIEKGVLDVQLRDRPLTNGYNNKKGPNSSHVSHRSKGLLIINIVLLLETPCH
jgi:hypothetical protein